MLVAALTGRTAEEVTGRGAGLNDVGLLRKQQVIAQALEKYEKEIRSAHALSMLAAFGGLDIAGMAGVCIGGALYHVPVVLDGLISSVAALVAERIVPGVREFVLPSHLSKERGKMDRGGTETSSGHRCGTGAWGGHRSRDAVFPSGSGTGTLRGSDNI